MVAGLIRKDINIDSAEETIEFDVRLGPVCEGQRRVGGAFDHIVAKMDYHVEDQNGEGDCQAEVVIQTETKWITR